MELKFVKPVAKNGKEVALVDEKDVASEVKRWENAVVAYFLGHDSTPGPPSFNKFISNLIDSEWRKYGNVKVYSQGSGVFVLDFESAYGKELALASGPRFYDGSKPFILKPWSRDMSLEIKELKSAPIWIKLPNLRLHLWSPEALSKIVSLVGRPLFADTVTTSRETLCFARICVEVDFDKMLPDSVRIEDDKDCSYDQKIEYEWPPTSRCSYCLHMGHSDSCPRCKTTFPCPCCKKHGRFCCKQSCGPARPLFGTAPCVNTPVYGANTSSSATAFGSTPALFGDKAPVFGANSSSTPAFGSTQTSVFGSTPESTTAPGANSPEEGAITPEEGSTPSSTFGSVPTAAFGSTPSSAFGSAPTAAFGSAPTTAFGSTPSSVFGSIPSSAFGSAPTAAFGSTPSSAFGFPPTAAFGSTPSSAFGFPPTAAFGSTPSSAFGFTPTAAFGSTPSSAFGSAPTASI